MNNLKKFRTEKGIAIWGLATEAGSSPSTISAIEKWGYIPGREVQERLAKVLEVEVKAIWPESKVEDFAGT